MYVEPFFRCIKRNISLLTNPFLQILKYNLNFKCTRFNGPTIPKEKEESQSTAGVWTKKKQAFFIKLCNVTTTADIWTDWRRQSPLIPRSTSRLSGQNSLDNSILLSGVHLQQDTTDLHLRHMDYNTPRFSKNMNAETESTVCDVESYHVIDLQDAADRLCGQGQCTDGNQ